MIHQFTPITTELFYLIVLAVLFLICAKVSEYVKGKIMPIVGVIIISLFSVFVFDIILQVTELITS